MVAMVTMENLDGWTDGRADKSELVGLLPLNGMQILNKKVRSEPNKLKRKADKTSMMVKFK